jgi:hypothetical protein
MNIYIYIRYNANIYIQLKNILLFSQTQIPQNLSLSISISLQCGGGGGGEELRVSAFLKKLEILYIGRV